MTQDSAAGSVKNATAAIVIIGNEVLSGRTKDANTPFIAERLNERGVLLREVRVVPDVEAAIVKAVNELRREVDYVFTTGGIGPTHDDITAASVAKAFGVAFARNPEAYEMLVRHYGDSSQVTEVRARMAMIPAGAALIPNPVSGAPGFVMENVYVMAGVPRIMQAMLDHVLGSLRAGPPMLSNTVVCGVPESRLAQCLADIQDGFPDVEIGSYPFYQAGGLGVSAVLRCVDAPRLGAATHALLGAFKAMAIEPQSMELQAPLAQQ